MERFNRFFTRRRAGAADLKKTRGFSDVLPEQAAERIAPLVDAGCHAIKKNLEPGRRSGSPYGRCD